MDEMVQLQEIYRSTPAAAQAQQPKKKGPGGLRGALTNFLPTIGGAAGAVLGGAGGAIAGMGVGSIPGAAVGAAGGGAVGSGIGEYLRQKLTGEADDGIDKGNIASEAAFGALPAVGKAVGAVKAARGAKGAIQAADNVPMKGVEELTGVGKLPQAAQTTEAALQQRMGVKGRIQNNARDTSQAGFGLGIGQSAGRGKVMTPEKADQLYDFTTNRAKDYGGIRAGKPIQQARDAQTVHNNVKKALDVELTKIDRPLEGSEQMGISGAIADKLRQSVQTKGKTDVAGRFDDKIHRAKSLKELEAIRREADDMAFTEAGAGKTAAAAQARAVREAIDEFITPMSDGYKAVKGDYTASRELLDATSKANKSAKGFTAPFTNIEIGKQAIPGFKNKLAAKLAGATGSDLVAADAPNNMTAGSFAKETARAAIPQAGYRAGSSALFGTPFVGDGTQPQEGTQQTGMPPSDMTDGMESPSPQQDSPFAPANAEANVQRILANGGTNKDVQEYLSIVETMQKFQPSGGKPLSAEASKVKSNALSGLESLAQLENAIDQEGGVSKGTLVPGRSMFGGFGANALGTAEYDTAAKNVKDVITRLRTGAAMSDQEASFYESMIPQAFDSPEVRAQKLDMFRSLFQRINSGTGTAGTDTQASISTAGQ